MRRVGFIVGYEPGDSQYTYMYHVYVYVYVHVHVYVYMSTYTYTYMHTETCMNAHMPMYLYLCMHVHAYTCKAMYLHFALRLGQSYSLRALLTTTGFGGFKVLTVGDCHVKGFARINCRAE